MVTKNDKKLGRNIHKLRRRSKLTQEQLAEKVGINAKHIQFIESARRLPSLKTLYKIARSLGVKVKELFSF